MREGDTLSLVVATSSTVPSCAGQARSLCFCCSCCCHVAAPGQVAGQVAAQPLLAGQAAWGCCSAADLGWAGSGPPTLMCR